ncbi:MAG: DHH family phosphoesterase [Candidatus Bathyarchaeota archaeon]
MVSTEIELEKLKKLLRGRILLLCHHNADPDSVCAAWGVKNLIMALDAMADAHIYLPGGVSTLSREIMESLKITAEEEVYISNYNTLVILDTATLNQLEDWGELVEKAEAEKIFIDHHTIHETVKSIASILIIDEKATSTCELVYGIYEAFGIVPQPDVARALLAGIAYDSRHFSIATPKTLKAASRLLEIDGSLWEILSMLTRDRDRSEKIARLKAAQRMQLNYINDWTLATSHLTSFQASAARALISLGADVSVVVGSEKGSLRASLRASEYFYKKTSLHLGEVAQILGSEFGGAGSGHPTAAGINGKGDLMDFLDRVVKFITESLLG